MTAAEFKKGAGSISDTTAGGAVANIDISGIVATYAHLLVAIYARGDTAAATIASGMRFNGDSAANYDYQALQGSAAVASANETFASTFLSTGFMPANTAGANLFSANLVFIPNYANATNNKQCISVGGLKVGVASTNLFALTVAGSWRSNAAINRITILPSAGNLVAGTRVTIYGLGA